MSNPPNLSAWHRVPVGATVPAGTLVFEVDLNDGGGVLYTSAAGFKVCVDGVCEYYTEHPIPDPAQVEIEERAERMYRAVHPALDDAWEYASHLDRARWIELAKEYKPC